MDSINKFARAGVSTVPAMSKFNNLNIIELFGCHGFTLRTKSPRIAAMRIASSISSAAESIGDALYAGSGPHRKSGNDPFGPNEDDVGENINH